MLCTKAARVSGYAVCLSVFFENGDKNIKWYLLRNTLKQDKSINFNVFVLPLFFLLFDGKSCDNVETGPFAGQNTQHPFQKLIPGIQVSIPN